MTKVMPGKAASAGPGPLANEAGYADVCNSPNSVTFMSLSYVFAETVNQAGHVDDAQGHLASLLAGHEKIWNCLLLFDTLYFSTLLPLLVVGPADLEPAEGMSDALASALFDAFDVLIAMSVCIVVLHTFVVIILYFGAAYVQSFPAETTAWFLLNFRNLFIFSKDVTRVAEFLSYSSTRPTRRDSTQLESKYLTLPATRLDSSRGSR